MPRRAKEEKNEVIIRGLLKQPDNKRCINCNSSGPQYVCTTFWTFICTNCSGVHREFNHRVKSVSMAKFNEEEIMSLQAGGNERAKQLYFKTWDPQRNSYPESGNLQKIRELVNHVYIDRRYCGENNSNRLSMVTTDSKSSSCDWPSAKSRWGRKDNFFGRSSFERADNQKATPSSNKVLNLQDFLEERSPRTPLENTRCNSLRSGPTRFEIVDDRFREDGRVKTYDRQSRGGSMSPRTRTTSLPAIHPVKAILGEKVPALRIEGPPGENVADAGEKVKENNVANSRSLIDFFDGETEPVSSNTNNESNSVEAVTDVSNMNPMDSLLLEWSSPVASPSAGISNSFGTGNSNNESNSISSNTNNESNSGEAVTDVSNMNPMDSLLSEWSSPVASPSAGISNSFGTGNSNTTVHNIQMHQLPQTQAFVSPGDSNTSSTTQQSATSVESSSNQHWNKSPPSNDLRPVESVTMEQSSQAVNPGEGSAYCARKEIPQDLFTSNFTSFAPAASGWHMQPPHGAYGMQYHHPAMSAATYPEPPKPRNPFDIGDDRYEDQGAIFPSMPPLQGALPNMPSSIPLESQSSPYTAAPSSHHPQVSPYGMNMSLVPGAYMGQMTINMPPTSNFDRREDAFASLNPIRQTSGPDLPTSPVPRVGNPFG